MVACTQAGGGWRGRGASSPGDCVEDLAVSRRLFLGGGLSALGEEPEELEDSAAALFLLVGVLLLVKRVLIELFCRIDSSCFCLSSILGYREDFNRVCSVSECWLGAFASIREI